MDTARFPRNLPTQFALGVTRRGGLRAIFAYQAAMAGASNQGGVITGVSNWRHSMVLSGGTAGIRVRPSPRRDARPEYQAMFAHRRHLIFQEPRI
jgi:hypothetical protein